MVYQRLQLCSAGSSRRILSAVSVKTVHLADIAPRQLLHDKYDVVNNYIITLMMLHCSHVVLGFSRYGNLLLSYCNELDVTATQSTYTLHCWLFQHPLPLKHVSDMRGRERLILSLPLSPSLTSPPPLPSSPLSLSDR